MSHVSRAFRPLLATALTLGAASAQAQEAEQYRTFKLSDGREFTAIILATEAAGFQVRGNIVWDKGDIEGKRGFNAGNFSPFYQAPFNCWEHVLVFRKPGTNGIITHRFGNSARTRLIASTSSRNNCA